MCCTICLCRSSSVLIIYFSQRICTQTGNVAVNNTIDLENDIFKRSRSQDEYLRALKRLEDGIIANRKLLRNPMKSVNHLY